MSKSQPHVAYAAYIHGEQHRYYVTRTINDITENLKPLDEIINDKFLPALFGRDISDEERELMSLPVKEGGLGIRKINKNSSRAHHTSRRITDLLVRQIKEQSNNHCNNLPSEDEVVDARVITMQRAREDESKEIERIKLKQSPDQQRSLKQLSEPGASSWLGALPIAARHFNLNKNEYQDALCLRYNMPIKNIPTNCPCGAKFDTTHALNCHKGGFVNARHDNIRDMESKLLQVVCRDVECEPPLQKIEDVRKKTYQKTAIVTDDARLDIRARGFWRPGQNAFFDVRVTNADCASQKNSKISTILKEHEQQKKRCYNRRVMEEEHGSFTLRCTPLIFTTSGVMGYECAKYHRTLADQLSKKRGERYEDVMRYLRVKLSFLALKSTLLCLRGSRSTFKNVEAGEDFAYTLDELGM